ncbi:MAG: DUF4249 domain-containing protein [Chlorobi bacterium]|nr:DUF4249 domain-containing protein [Chlorobiota bacterium]
MEFYLLMLRGEKHIILLFTGLLAGLGACTEKIDLQLDTGEPRIVIEGSISNRQQSQIVKITQSSGYFSTAQPVPVEGAIVTLSDSANQINLTETFSGIYLTPPFFAGVPGTEYTLTVETGGKIYTAHSVMPRPPVIDSINFSEDDVDPLLFHIRLYAPESPVPGDHYFFGVFREGIYQTDNLTKLIFATDKLINGRYIYGLPVQSVEASPGNRVTLQMAAIPKDFFDYSISVLRVTVYNDNPFEQAPANPPGNISGGALGFFYAFAEARKTRMIRIIN